RIAGSMPAPTSWPPVIASRVRPPHPPRHHPHPDAGATPRPHEGDLHMTPSTTVLVWLLRCTTPTLEQDVFLTPPACYDRLASYARQFETPTSDAPYRER